MVTNSPNHHPDADALLDYASGKASQASSVLIATHLALCPECRAVVREYEALGGALIEDQAPVAVSSGALAATLAMLDEDDIHIAPAPRGNDVDAETLRVVPQPLRGYLNGSLDSLAWRARGRGIQEASVDMGDSSIRASMLRIAPGETIPSHTHSAIETTIVLKGAFSDDTGRYARGDVATAMDDLDHAPVADRDEECICFIVVEGDLRLTGTFGRMLNLFVRP